MPKSQQQASFAGSSHYDWPFVEPNVSSAFHCGLPFRNVKKTDLFVVAPHGRARARSSKRAGVEGHSCVT